MRGARRGIGHAAAWVVLAVSIGSAGAAPPGQRATRRAYVSEGAVATIEGGNRIYLEVQAGPRDSWVSLAMRWAGTERAWSDLERANAGRRVTAGMFHAIPFEVLLPEHRARALVALFPEDAPGEWGWVHRVAESDRGQTLESVAAWFTGEARHAAAIAESNGIDTGRLDPGTEILIPDDLLLAGLDAAASERHLAARPAPAIEEPPKPAPPPDRPEARPPGRVTVGDLEFVTDEAGDYAVYRLRRGEALYSAVVSRYTGRLDPKEVTAVAETIASLSGIRRVDAIPVGHPIRIPRHLILPEHLPPDDPRRRDHDADLQAAQRHEVTARAQALEGVAIILDAGHGGDDVGAQRNGVHEDDYVYDVMCRIKALAEKETGARVLTTIRDKSAGYRPHKGPFRIDNDEYLLTNPPYHPRKPHVGTAGVNLRWYLVNSYYRALRAEGFDAQRVVFVSLHADSRHAAVRGAMVYVPGQDYRRDTYGHRGQLYDRREVTEARFVKFSSRERERSEGLSRRLAERLIATLREADIPVHAEKPIRDHVIRGRRTWTPAVIRASQVPQSVLFEIVNLNNPKDAKLLLDPEFRERVARAFLDALRAHYEGAPGSGTVTAAR